jgi:hypothetical protein
VTLTSPGRLVTAWCRDGRGVAQIAAVMALDDYPFANTVGGVDPARLQRVVDVIHQFLGFNSSFNINSMLIGADAAHRPGSGFGDPPLQEPALGGGAGQVQRALVFGPGLGPATEAA